MRAGGRAAAAVAERIVNCLPAASVEMETFCRLASIELVDDGEAGAPGARGPAVRTTPAVRTAAVECADRPRLLLNARFLREYCRRDEHLFLLVMHELWHVILGHTRLYPRIDLADEIAFDAVINAGLARQFRGPEYLGFFDRLNPADSFPALLLRPPAGWPDDPVYPGLGPAGTLRVLRQLYPPPDYPPTVSIPSHAELVALIAAGPRGRKRCEPLLLGDHETGPAGGGSLDPGAAPTRAQRALADPLLADVLRRSVAHWPEPPFVLGNPGRGGFPSAHDVLPAPAAEAARRVFARLLRRCLVEGPSRERRRTRVAVPVLGGPAPLPNARDRLAPARRRLGLPATLYAQPAIARSLAREPDGVAHVYLDVSGSMAALLPRLVGLLRPHALAGRAKVFQFSTTVWPLPAAQLRRGEIRTTGGTAIDPVLQHAVDAPRVRRILVLTDGVTGDPHRRLAKKVRARRIKVHVVLPAESAHRRHLEGIAASVTVLPGVDRD